MIDLLSMFLQGLVTLVFAFIGSYIMWKVAGPRVVVTAIREQMGPILINWLMTPSIPTGKKKKMTADDNEEVEFDEVLAPIDLMMTRAGELVYQKLMGKLGGDVRKKQAVTNDIIEGMSMPGSPYASLLSSINPKLVERALKDGDYMPIILEQLGPLVARYAENKLNKKGDTFTSSNGGL